MIWRKRKDRHGHWRDSGNDLDPGPDRDTGFNPGGPVYVPASYSISGDTSTHSASTGLVEEPIKAWKRSLVAQTSDGWRFVGNGIYYKAESVAQCGQGKNHQCPDPKCSCGFYALADRNAVAPWGYNVVLEVELYGRVMVGTKGYRAEKQRVLAVHADRTWGAAQCQCPFAFHAIYGGTGSYGSPEDQHRGAVEFRNRQSGELLCAHHAVMKASEGARIEAYVHELPEPPDLGTEWRWVE